jgi:hypothetical protein
MSVCNNFFETPVCKILCNLLNMVYVYGVFSKFMMMSSLLTKIVVFCVIFMVLIFNSQQKIEFFTAYELAQRRTQN